MTNPPTHIAYSDESYQTGSRYRSIAVITLDAANERYSMIRALESSNGRDFAKRAKDLLL